MLLKKKVLHKNQEEVVFGLSTRRCNMPSFLARRKKRPKDL